MTFRVRFVDPDGTWWTGPLASFVDAGMLVATQRARGLEAEIHVESRALKEQWVQLLAGSFAEQQATGQPQVGLVRFGCRYGKCVLSLGVQIVRVPERPPAGPLPPGEHPADCQCTPCTLQRELLKNSIQPTFPAVFGVWPLLEAGSGQWPVDSGQPPGACNQGAGLAKCEPCDDEQIDDEEVWELAPPTSSEVSAHTPWPTSQAAPLRQVQPLLAQRRDPWWVAVTDFLDRVGGLIVRAIVAPRGTRSAKSAEAAR